MLLEARRHTLGVGSIGTHAKRRHKHHCHAYSRDADHLFHTHTHAYNYTPTHYSTYLNYSSTHTLPTTGSSRRNRTFEHTILTSLWRRKKYPCNTTQHQQLRTCSRYTPPPLGTKPPFQQKRPEKRKLTWVVSKSRYY